MPQNSPRDVIEAYRRRQKRRFPFTLGDISKALLFLVILAASIYIAFTGGPDLPVLIELKTNTPTYTPSITPTASQTATITSTPTETPDPAFQCDCPSPVIIVVTATFAATDIPLPTETVTMSVPSTSTLLPDETVAPTETPSPVPTQHLYTVQRGDTLGSIALKFGVTVEAIQMLNNLDTTIITIGQVLQIPAP